MALSYDPPMSATNVLDQFANSLEATDAERQLILAQVRHFAEWHSQRRGSTHEQFAPKGGDDVDLRTYLLELRNQGMPRREIEQRTQSLKRFYAWAAAEKLMRISPFDEFDLERPILTPAQIRHRHETLPEDPTQRELVRLRALNRLAEALNRISDLRTALDVTLQVLVETMGLHTAWAFLWDQSGITAYLHPDAEPHDFVLSAACDLPAGLARNEQHHLRVRPDCQCQWLLRNGRLKRAVNVVECTRLQDAAEDEGDTRGLLFHATVPLMAQGKPVGLINIAAEEWQFFSAGDLQMLTTAGTLVTAAIERAWLFARSTELGAVEERNRLAREIHDTLSQGLTAIALQLETADALLEHQPQAARAHDAARSAVQYALSLARINLAEARRSVLDLRAAPLESRTLAQALDALAKTSTSPNLQVTFALQGRERALPARVEISLYRIAQEALNNVAQHAQAKQVQMCLRFAAEQVQWVIEDDGVGFDVDHAGQGRIGLISMNERARLAGGALRLSSEAGHGTQIEVTIPLGLTSGVAK